MLNFFDKFSFTPMVNEILCATVVFLISVLAIRILEFVLIKKLGRIAERTKTLLDDLFVYLIKRSMVFFYVGAIYIGLLQIHFDSQLQRIVNISLKVLISVYVVFILIVTIDWFVEKYLSLNAGSSLKRRSFKGAMSILKVLVYTFGLVLILDNLGVNVTALITGLGISGIAVALAAQRILGDLFNYFAIILDKPFEEGDFISFNNFAGTVEHIGLKSTRIRSLSGEEIVVSNTSLINEYIQNFKRMNNRRVVFKIGVIYETPMEKLKRIPQIIKTIIDKIDGATFDRCHFVNFGDFSLDFETVYYVEDSDYLHYMNIHQEINLKIAEEFKKEGIEFAYPTQLIYLNKEVKSEN